MRKRLMVTGRENGSEPAAWLDLERIARAELTSEDPQHTIEAALDGSGSGWRASSAGAQTIRLSFDDPQTLRRIAVRFEEREGARTQEFVLSWSAADGAPLCEIVRQQYSFSAPDTSVEVETYNVDLQGVGVLELTITPDVAGSGDTVASLALLRLS